MPREAQRAYIRHNQRQLTTSRGLNVIIIAKHRNEPTVQQQNTISNAQSVGL